MPRDAEALVAVKDGDQLDGDFSAMLIGRHGEQKSSVGDGDLIAFRGSDEALAERLESLGQRVQERVKVQQSLDLRFIEHQDVHMALLQSADFALDQLPRSPPNSTRLTPVYPRIRSRNKLKPHGSM